MNDIKKVLIVAICVVLVIAIAAGVSIGVMANTMNGLKDRVEELDQAYASDVAAMKAEIEAAKAANENLVTAADFEAKLAAAIGEQNQTMQSLISTAVKNQIEDLEVEGLTEEQVNEIIDAAVANCLTEADIDAIIADIDTGLTKDEVKKLITNNTAGYLTYAQIANMIDDADYDLRKFLEDTLKEYTDELGKRLDADLDGVKDQIGKVEDSVENKTAKVTLDAATFTEDEFDLADLVSGGKIVLKGDWTGRDLTITCDDAKDFIIDATGITMGVLTINAPESHVEVIADGAAFGGFHATTAPDSLVITGAATIGSVTVNKGRVVIEEATVTEVTLVGNETKLEIGSDATVTEVVVEESATNATVSNEGTVGEITVNAEATVSNEGTVESIVVGNEDAVVENNGTVEEIIGGGELAENYDSINYVTTVKDLLALKDAEGSLLVVLNDDITIGVPASEGFSEAVVFENATSLTINGNGHKISMIGEAKYCDCADNLKAGIIVRNGDVTINNATIYNDKRCGHKHDGTQNCSSRSVVYTMVKGTTVTYNDVTFDGAVVVYDDTVFTNCEFKVEFEWHFALFVDNEYGNKPVKKVVLDGCKFTADGSYGCVKVADDKLVGVELTIKDCEFACSELQFASETLPAADVKVTGKVAVITEGTNDFTYGIVANKDNGGATLNGETMTVKTLY